MTTAFPYPAKENGYLAEHVNLLRTCLHTLTGRELLEKDYPPAEAARRIFYAPFALLSHTAAADPVLTYGNHTVLNLFELTWEELIQAQEEEDQRLEQLNLFE